MPYIFGLLVLANVALLGYSLFMPSGSDKNVEEAKSRLTASAGFTNTTNQLPPEIGEKK